MRLSIAYQSHDSIICTTTSCLSRALYVSVWPGTLVLKVSKHLFGTSLSTEVTGSVWLLIGMVGSTCMVRSMGAHEDPLRSLALPW